MAALRSDYGVQKPAPVDPQAPAKIRGNLNLDPFKKFMGKASESGCNDLTKLVICGFGCNFGSRGKKEVSMLLCALPQPCAFLFW